MKKVISIILVILVIVIYAGIFYLNEVLLPTKIKAFVIREIENATQKKVSLVSLRFHILKGFVLRELTLYDGGKTVLSVRKASCSLFVLPIFKNKIIIPAIRIEDPLLFIERRSDNSINISDLFKKYTPDKKFEVILRKIIVKNGRIHFDDRALSPVFAKEITDLNIHLYLALPKKVQFDLQFEIPSAVPVSVDSSGEYIFSEKELIAKVDVKDFSAADFSSYYKGFGIAFPEGKIDSFMKLDFKDDLMKIEATVQTKELAIEKDKISITLNSDVKADCQYSVTDKKFIYTGDLDIKNMTLSGVEAIGRVGDIKGKVLFSNSRLSSDKLTATILNQPVEIKGNYLASEEQQVNLYIAANPDLHDLQEILKDKFKILIPADITGKGRLDFSVEYKTPLTEPVQVKGTLDMLGAAIKPEGLKSPFENVTGQFGFTQNQLTWSDLSLKYLENDYKTSGTLTDFNEPGVQIKLSSRDLDLESIFACRGNLYKLSKFKGRYLKSAFSVSGDVDLNDPSKVNAALEGALDTDLTDLRVVLKNFKEKFEKMKLLGTAHADFTLNGDLKNLKSCVIGAKIMSNAISFYDLKPTNLIIDYSQKDGVADMKRIHSFLYGGTVEAMAKIDFAAKDLPYSVSGDIDGIRLEKLKADTSFKDKEIAGAVKIRGKISGYANDVSRLSGWGKITITEGKLWQLNLFKGLGTLIFTSDFSNIMFRDGNCDFIIKNGAVFTDDLRLNSDLLNMRGFVKLDFHNSITATLKAEIPEGALEPGTRENIATTLGRYSLIEIEGTLKKPKYTIKPDVADIMDAIGRIFLAPD